MFWQDLTGQLLQLRGLIRWVDQPEDIQMIIMVKDPIEELRRESERPNRKELAEA